MFQHEPLVRVGIIESPRVRYIVNGAEHEAVFAPDFREIYIPAGPFTLCGVTIGKQFHWEQQEDQTFVGALRIIAADDHLVAINEVRLEDYLASVISSEMAATNNLQLLMTHAIISRSWVLRQMNAVSQTEQEDATPIASATDAAHSVPPARGDRGVSTLIRWWDHDDHTLYDVCADDHCQRYQGVTRQVSPLVAEAIRQTRGQVLLDNDGRICDARFYKACGGHTERFDACWQNHRPHYLAPKPDPYCAPQFIERLPGGMEGVMRQVLNDYDRSTVDYHNWTERYTATELSALVERRLHAGLGRVVALDPIERGASGRIVRLRIVGTERSIVIGKELLIRKALSESHLKSSWFDVETVLSPDASQPYPSAFVLHGHGWGHGVGLCQIGAAAMSLAGYAHTDILAHYFDGARIGRLYE